MALTIKCWISSVHHLRSGFVRVIVEYDKYLIQACLWRNSTLLSLPFFKSIIHGAGSHEVKFDFAAPFLYLQTI